MGASQLTSQGDGEEPEKEIKNKWTGRIIEAHGRLEVSRRA